MYVHYLTYKIELELELTFYLELELHLEAQEQGEKTATKQANWSKKLKSGEWQTTGKIQVLQGLEQDFVSKQVKSLDRSGQERESSYFEICSRPGGGVRALGREDGKKKTRNEVFCAHGRIMYVTFCINWYVSTKYAYLCVHVRTYIYICVLFNA